MRTAPPAMPATLLVCLLASLSSAGAADTVEAVKQPPTDSTNNFYVATCKPLLATPLVKLPVGAVRPQGWLRSPAATADRGLSRTPGRDQRVSEKGGECVA